MKTHQRFKLCSFQHRFTVDIKPSKEVSEYTATIAYKLLSEGKDGRQKVDSLKFALRAEGMSILFGRTFYIDLSFSMYHNHYFFILGYVHQ